MKNRGFTTPLTMAALAAAAAVLLLVVAAGAEKPPCTGDRHDHCEAACDDDGAHCPDPAPCVAPAACPDPAPCQPVVCEDGDDGQTVVVEVARCPDVVFPAYAPCRERKDGKARAGDVTFEGRPYKCPRKATPHRYLIPLVTP